MLAAASMTVDGYEAGPMPPAPIPLWLGSAGATDAGRSPDASSDGWVSPLSTYRPPDAVPAAPEADRRGRTRRPDATRQPCAASITWSARSGRRRGGPGLTGDVQTWVDTLTGWSVDLGLDTFIFWPMTSPMAQLEVFASKVVPGVRQRVSERRGKP